MSSLTTYLDALSDTVAEGTVSMLTMKSDVNDVFMTYVLLHDHGCTWPQEYRERIYALWMGINATIDELALKHHTLE